MIAFLLNNYKKGFAFPVCVWLCAPYVNIFMCSFSFHVPTQPLVNLSHDGHVQLKCPCLRRIYTTGSGGVGPSANVDPMHDLFLRPASPAATCTTKPPYPPATLPRHCLFTTVDQSNFNGTSF